MISSTASSGSSERRNNQEQPEGADVANKPSQAHQSVAQQVLADAIACRQTGYEGLIAVRPQLLKLFGRIERLDEQLDQVFGGQAFFLDLSPTCPANLRRFNTYVELRSEVMRLLGKAIELWMLTCGIQRVPNQSAARPRKVRQR